jgi:hypothetical protein
MHACRREAGDVVGRLWLVESACMDVKIHYACVNINVYD